MNWYGTSHCLCNKIDQPLINKKMHWFDQCKFVKVYIAYKQKEKKNEFAKFFKFFKFFNKRILYVY